jgi:hypothetical protein
MLDAVTITKLLMTYGPWGFTGFMAWLYLRSEQKRDADRTEFFALLQEKYKELRNLSMQVVTVATSANANNAGLIAVLGAPRK